MKENNSQYLLPVVKFEFLKIRIYHHGCENFLMFKDVSDEIGGDLNKEDFSILYNKICEHLENLPDSVKQYSVNDQNMMLKWFLIPHCSFSMSFGAVSKSI